MRTMDDVTLHHQVFKNKLGGVAVVGVNTAHLGGRQINLIDALVLEKRRHRLLRG
ncbi:hypothetical protein D3C87_1789270 [compost metagenome]